MTKTQEAIALDMVNNPPPGSELAKAKEFGVDLTLLLSALRFTPTERARILSEGARVFEITELAQLAEK
jgi:hypothetical protein